MVIMSPQAFHLQNKIIILEVIILISETWRMKSLSKVQKIIICERYYFSLRVNTESLIIVHLLNIRVLARHHRV